MRLLPIFAGLAAATAALAVPLPRNFAIENYDVSIQPDLAARRLTGEATIRFHSRIDGLGALELDTGGVEILSVTDGHTKEYTERRNALLIVVLPKPLNSGAQGTVVVSYRAAPAKGLVFFPGQVYASLFAGDWIPCSDRIEDRATLRLRISADPRWKVAASGKLAGTTTQNGRSVTEWRIETPTPPSLYGFAAGDFAETTAQKNKVTIRTLAPAGVAAGPLGDAAAAALQFFGERTGAAYPFDTYTQVFAQGDPLQAAVGMSLLPATEAAKAAKDPEDLWALADALAHQWYGVAVSYPDWSEFWLSEGISAFMADAFLESRFGKARYEKEMERSRAAFESMQQDGKDRALVFTDWQTPEQAFGQLPVQKGVWVLDQLRRQLTDPIFWRGLRRFTLSAWGKPATSDDLEKALQAASGKKLDKFFDRWVTGCCAKLPEKGSAVR